MSAPRRSSSLHVHEAVLEDRLVDHADAVGDAVQRHELRLHVGRERRVRRGGEVRPRCGRRPCMSSVMRSPSTVIRAPASRELVEHRIQRVGARCGAR